MPKTPDSKLMNDPLKNARGHGSAHHGVEHWMMQKVTAIANIPLVLWFVYSMINLYSDGASYEGFTAWVGAPLNTILLVAMFVSVFYHAKLGTENVIEDYISNEGFKRFKLIGLKLFFTLFAIACIVSVLKIAFTAGI